MRLVSDVGIPMTLRTKNLTAIPVAEPKDLWGLAVFLCGRVSLTSGLPHRGMLLAVLAGKCGAKRCIP
jgi:hypothetical protein